MAKFKVKQKAISGGTKTVKEREVEAESFETVGEFIDFWENGLRDREHVVLRLRADTILEIERTEK